MNNKILFIGFIIIIVFFAFLYIKGKNQSNTYQPDSSQIITNAPQNPTMASKKLNPPAMEIDTNKKYTAVMQTSLGNITIELNAKETPVTANNFIYLAKNKFYDNTVFHRVIKGFMIQGGDPTGTGAGGPGYTFKDEPFTGEYKRGTIAMANAGPNTNGSQFFIMHADYALPPNYVIFGHVTGGMETVDKIAESAVATSDTGENSRPLTPTVVTTVDIQEQ